MSQKKDFTLQSIEIKNILASTYRSEIVRDVYTGLTAPNKSIPSKYFYDSRGSALFEEICCQEEYYPTRTEMSILKNAAPSIMESFHEGDLVELGSGANWKIKILLDALDKSNLLDIRYVPMDVSEKALLSATEELLQDYPELKVLAVVGDFTRHIHGIKNGRSQLIVFFGSTIGNFNEEERLTFLKIISSSMKPGDRFLIGLDMVKSKTILEAAYNDSKGVTSEFNKNVLHVMNRELNTNFNPSYFSHRAFFNREKERVEMHLQATRRMSVEVGDLGLQVDFDEGETIRTEICKKFSKGSAEQMFCTTGFSVTQWFSDPDGWFSLVELKLKDKS